MTARIPCCPARTTPSDARLDAWTIDLRPRDEVERYLVERAVRSPGSSTAPAAPQAARLADARHAGAGRVAEQADEVVTLGRRLFWDPVGPAALYPHLGNGHGSQFGASPARATDDPDEPARIVERLEARRSGCAWLLDRWGELRTSLEDG